MTIYQKIRCCILPGSHDLVLAMCKGNILRVQARDSSLIISSNGIPSHTLLQRLCQALRPLDLAVRSSTGSKVERGDWFVEHRSNKAFVCKFDAASCEPVEIKGRAGHNARQLVASVYGVTLPEAAAGDIERSSSSSAPSSEASEDCCASSSSLTPSVDEHELSTAASSSSLYDTIWGPSLFYTPTPVAAACPTGVHGGAEEGTWRAPPHNSWMLPPAAAEEGIIIDNCFLPPLMAAACPTGVHGGAEEGTWRAPPHNGDNSWMLPPAAAEEGDNCFLPQLVAAARPTGVHGDDDDMLCVVCMESPRNIVLVPCGHLVLCEACYQEMQQANMRCCPMCREEITDDAKVY
ncbi:hypothetical protein OEZ85_011073 [Tetradesmus obliquus]|uniref:RING-type domain-containing protein n=1 Tax=Tetradesmus obliquus TaxID=3088 RepID=A0ABY8TTU8_TETOB|nr:hypothetical protein OEZ85_011073 [Tetradesmus obliquus]